MPTFTPNYPQPETRLLSTPERTGALPQYTGKGVVIAFIDSGFYAHPDLSGRIRVHVDATTADIVESTAVPTSQTYSWHGQMTSVIAAGSGKRSDGLYRGIAAAAELVLIKVSSPRNQIKERDILRGLTWLVKHHPRFGVKIVNLSVGGDYECHRDDHPIYAAVRELTAAGVCVVAAAGNRGERSLYPPASSAEAITVGGVDDHNTREREQWTLYHHNYGVDYRGGGKPDLLAPAQWIASPILPRTRVAREAFWLGPLLHTDTHIHTTRWQQGARRLFGDHPNENLYAVLQARIYAHKLVDAYHQHVEGTSVAAPIVAAVIAQMLEANPALTPAQVKAALAASAQRLTNARDELQGAGVVNPSGAVAAALAQG